MAGRDRRAGRGVIATAILLLAFRCQGAPAAGGVSARIDGRPIQAGASVLEHHGGPSRSGFYTQSGVSPGSLHIAFRTTVDGKIYAQPLFVDMGGSGAIIAVTEKNKVYAIDAASGAVIWSRTLGAPVPLSNLPCGNIDPLGITGTPVIDPASRTLYLDAMTSADGGKTSKHQIFALSIDDGSTRAGWPVDVAAAASYGSLKFDSRVQNQRGALALLGGMLYVPYGGHFGDCGDYHGWIVGVPTANPAQVAAWATSARGGGIWAPSGITSDGASLFASTGNTFDVSAWAGGEAVLRFTPGPVFSGAPADWFAPTDWKELDDSDLDLGGSGVSLIDVSGKHFAAALGKDGKVYLADRGNLGGLGGAVFSSQVSTQPIITGPAVYTTARGAYLVFRSEGSGCPAGQRGDLVALSITASAARVAWCSDSHGRGSPMATSTPAGAVVWIVGAQGDGRLHAYDGDTGRELGQSDAMGPIAGYQTPVAAKGRVIVGADGAVFSLAP